MDIFYVFKEFSHLFFENALYNVIKGDDRMKNPIRVGLLGVGRGSILWKYCKEATNAKLVAICDKWEQGLENAKKKIEDDSITYYTDFEKFIKHDMDAVFLANYATEHAPFAIKAMREGKHVISEVLPVQTMAEAVELIECCEETGKKYCYAENYCYMVGPYEMKKRYFKGDLGEFEYGEGEYMHNCEPIWSTITQGNPRHWRNNMSAFYYCTHSAGPLLHITGLRPIKVVGVEGAFNPRMARMGAKAGNMAIELATLENGAVIKSIHGIGPSKDSIWYSIYGSKGRLETAREDAKCGNTVYANLDEVEGITKNEVDAYVPVNDFEDKIKSFGHGGSDYICLWNAFEHLLGHVADTISVYEALDMWMIGFFGYLSVLNGGAPQEIPNLRLKEVRDAFRHDLRCTTPEVAGDMLLPSYSKGNPHIDSAIYEKTRKKWEEDNK